MRPLIYVFSFAKNKVFSFWKPGAAFPLLFVRLHFVLTLYSLQRKQQAIYGYFHTSLSSILKGEIPCSINHVSSKTSIYNG